MVWRSLKLADCVGLLAGFAFKSQQFTDRPGDIPLVKGENIGQGKILWDKSKRWPSADCEKFEKYQLRPGDVVVAMDRPWVPAGLKWAFLRVGDPRALLVQRVARLRAKADVLDQTYLRFVIGGPAFESYVRPVTTGVNVPHISGQQILDFTLRVPPLRIQRQVAAVLTVYDDLIDNTQRRVEILERMARDLHREWFVSFRYPGHESVPLVSSPLGQSPSGWQVKRLGEVLTLNYGKALPKESRRDGQYPVYGSSGVVGSHDTSLARGPGLVIGRKGNVGTVFWSDSDFFVIDTAYYVTASLPLRYLFYDLQLKNFINNDAAVPGLSRQQAYSLNTVVPPQSLLDRFCSETCAIDDYAAVLRRQIVTLSRTRNLLLPRLLSGELEPSEATA